MNNMKNIIVVVVLVASVVQAIPDAFKDKRIESMCGWMAKQPPKGLEMNSRDALLYYQQWARANNRHGSYKEYESVFEPWTDILQKDCPKDSFNSMVVMNWCQSSFPAALVADPLKAFVGRCLNSELVYQHVKAMSMRMLREVPRVLIDAQFLAKFREDNPQAGPINLDYKSLDAFKAVGAIAEALKKDYARAGKDPKERNKYNPSGLNSDVASRIVYDCRRNVENGFMFAKDLESVGQLWEGGQEAMIASLAPEAQAAVFRYTFCANIYEMSLADTRALVKAVETKLLV